MKKTIDPIKRSPAALATLAKKVNEVVDTVNATGENFRVSKPLKLVRGEANSILSLNVEELIEKLRASALASGDGNVATTTVVGFFPTAQDLAPFVYTIIDSNLSGVEDRIIDTIDWYLGQYLAEVTYTVCDNGTPTTATFLTLA